jgi:hypothetical protein
MFDLKVLGAIFGVVIGTVGVWQGPLEAFIVALLGIAGWIIGRFIAGEMPAVDQFIERLVETRRRDRRR